MIYTIAEYIQDMKIGSIREKDPDEKFLQLAGSIDTFEGYANPHSRRIADLSEAVARKFNFSSYDLRMLYQAALVHDIGELTMNREYIKINRRLEEDERADMQRHPVIGEQESAKREFPRAVQLLVRWHHEWWNGNGYPDALKGENIPLAARILRVADTFCSLTGDRPFRSAFSVAEAKKILADGAGIEFQPLIVKYFLELPELND